MTTCGNFFEKMTIFGNSFEKKKSPFLAIFRHSNGKFPEGQVITGQRSSQEILHFIQDWIEVCTKYNKQWQ